MSQLVPRNENPRWRNTLSACLQVSALALLVALPEYADESQNGSCGAKAQIIVLVRTTWTTQERMSSITRHMMSLALLARIKSESSSIDFADSDHEVLIEAQYNESYWTNRYQKYLGRDYTLGRNETEQIGFRLAKSLGLATIYPVDYEMSMDGACTRRCSAFRRQIATSCTPGARIAF